MIMAPFLRETLPIEENLEEKLQKPADDRYWQLNNCGRYLLK